MTIIVLGRLLSPADFGLVAIVTSITGIGEMLRDFGLSLASIQAKNLSIQQRNNLFWANLAIGTIFAIVIILLAPLLASLYGIPSLSPIAKTIAIVFLANGASAQFRASLARDLAFGRLALVDVGSQVLGLAAAIALATKGFGYWSLVGMQLVIAFSALAISLSFSGWVPGLPSSSTSLRSFFRFGANISGSQGVTYLSKNVDNISLGFFHGSTAVGFYSRAFLLSVMPITQVHAALSRVTIPILAKIQGDQVRLQTASNMLFSTVLLLSVWPLVFAAAFSQQLISLSLGPGWNLTATIFSLLAISSIFELFGYVFQWIVISQGRSRDFLVFTLRSRGFLIVAIIFTAHSGPVPVACAYLLWNAAMVFFQARLLQLSLGVRMQTPIRALGYSLLLSGIASLTSLILAREWIGQSNAVLMVTVGGSVGTGIFLLMTVCVRPSRVIAVEALKSSLGGAAPVQKRRMRSVIS